MLLHLQNCTGKVIPHCTNQALPRLQLISPLANERISFINEIYSVHNETMSISAVPLENFHKDVLPVLLKETTFAANNLVLWTSFCAQLPEFSYLSSFSTAEEVLLAEFQIISVKSGTFSDYVISLQIAS